MTGSESNRALLSLDAADDGAQKRARIASLMQSTPKFPPLEQTNVLSRVASFLPQLQAANEALKDAPVTNTIECLPIDSSSDDDSDALIVENESVGDLSSDEEFDSDDVDESIDSDGDLLNAEKSQELLRQLEMEIGIGVFDVQGDASALEALMPTHTVIGDIDTNKPPLITPHDADNDANTSDSESQ